VIPNRSQPIVALLLAAALLPLMVGCAIPYRVGVNDRGAPRYKRVDISYRIPGSHRALAHNADGDGVIAASAETDAIRSTATLKIAYPHPEDKPQLARATLRVSEMPKQGPTRSIVTRLRSSISWLPGSQMPTKEIQTADDEVWVLDFPREQLDLMLVDLAQSGFFEDQSRHEGTVWLSIAIDRGSMSKTWSAEARLDDFVQRVQREGRRTNEHR